MTSDPEFPALCRQPPHSKGDYGVGRVAAHAFVIDPHKHAIQQTVFLYVYEPGSNRVEVANAGARLILAPNWKPIVWAEEERKKGQAWG